MNKRYLLLLFILIPLSLFAQNKQLTISQTEWDSEVNRLLLQERMNGSLPEGDALLTMKQQLLDNYVTRCLLITEAKSLDLTVDSSLVDREFKNYVAQAGSQEAFDQALMMQDYTLDSFRTALEEAFLIQMLFEEEIASIIEINDLDISNYYEANKANFVQQESVSARHILLGTEGKNDEEKQESLKKAESILIDLKGGADFAQTAQQYSTCPSSSRGGDLGSFGRGQMVTPFEEAAFTLDPGEISDIVETQFGYHIILVYEKTSADPIPFDDLKEDIALYLEGEKVNAQVPQYIENLKAEYTIELPEF